MFGFIGKVFFTAMTFFSFNGIAFNPLNVNSLECVSRIIRSVKQEQN